MSEKQVEHSAATHCSLSIVVGEELFAFASFEQWVNKTAGWFRSYRVRSDDTLCVDAVGRICRVGKQFMRARDEGTFPIRVFMAVVDVSCTCPTLDGIKVVGSACPLHGFESCEI